MSDYCPRHPRDRKPYLAPPELVRPTMQMIAKCVQVRQTPVLTDNLYHTDPAGRNTRLDIMLAVVEEVGRQIDVPIIVEIEPGGVFVLTPLHPEPS